MRGIFQKRSDCAHRAGHAFRQERRIPVLTCGRSALGYPRQFFRIRQKFHERDRKTERQGHVSQPQRVNLRFS